MAKRRDIPAARLSRWLGLLAALAAGPVMAAQAPRVWTIQELFARNVGTPAEQDTAFAPHRIIGNVYYVGTESLASFLVTTPEGHVLINSDYERNVPTIRHSVASLNLRFEDIRILLGSHAHGDHMQGDGAVVEMTGARVFAMAEDLPALLSMRSPSGVARPPYGVLRDGSQVTLGGTTLTAHHTPGHTPGCTTWTLDVSDGGRPYHVVIIGSVGVNPGTNLAGNPDLVADYQKSFQVLRALPADVPLGSHPGMFGLSGKYLRLPARGPNPYVDPQGYRDEITIQETAFTNELKRQQIEGPPVGRGGRGGIAPAQD